MTWLWAQSLSLLALAYFIGTALACFTRRAISAGRATAPVYERATTTARDAVPAATAGAALRRVDPLPEMVQQRGLASRLERSMTGDTIEQPRPAPQPVPALKPAPVVQPTPAPAAQPASEIRAAPVAKAASATIVAAPVPKVAPVPPPVAPQMAPQSTTRVAPAVPIAAAAVAVPTLAPIVSKPTAPLLAGIATAPTALAHDLKRIRGIDAGVETALNRIGINRYDQIARWQKPDVAKLNAALGFRGRIEHENWIEQAQILSQAGGETEFSRRYGGSDVTLARPTPDTGDRRTIATPAAVGTIPVAPAATAPPAAPAPAPGASFAVPPAPMPGAAAAATMAAGMAAATAAAMSAAAPVLRATPTAAPAAPAVPPVLTPTPAATTAVRIAPAATAASAITAGVAAVAAAVRTPTPDVEQRAAFAASQTGLVQPSAAASAKPELAPAQAMRPASASRDALQRIGGINSEIERQLNGLGISRYAQISGWSKNDVDKVDGVLGMPGRIARENWVEQAQMLSRGGDTAYSRDFDRRGADQSRDVGARDPRSTKLADAIRENAPRTGDAPPAGAAPQAPRNDMGALRSVRSDAYRFTEPQGGLAGAADATGARVVRSAEPNDLKRIRGIGVLLERKLNSHGIAGYGQIANWTAEDIERVGQTLGFPGRIERENWVEQARILASGGTTEFSSRFDRGEVDVARPRGT